jgi:hypothetical protein
VQRGSSYHDQAVTLGSLSATEAVITSGLEEGAVVSRNIGNPGASR